MDREIELKFLIAPEAAEQILSLLDGESDVRQLDATYFDTADHALRKAGFGLRVRDGEGGRKQTLKSASAGGVFSRGEWETPIAGPGPDQKALAATPAAAVLNGQALLPVFTTQVERIVRLVRRGDTVIEAVVDRGALLVGSRRAVVCELELELKSGSPSALFALARDVARQVPLRLSLVSKAERGYGLAKGAAGGAPGRRSAARLDPAMTVGAALQASGREALTHLCASVDALRDRPGPEGVHQLRVAVRRTRSLLKSFKPLAADAAARSLALELKWLAGELDAARNLDVFVADVWRPASEAEPAQDLAAFGRALLEAQTQAYLRVEAALESPRQRALLLETAAWLEAGAWTTDAGLVETRNRPAAGFAAEILGHMRQVVIEGGEHLEDMEPEARHRLRLKGKTLRYAAEDLAGLFPEHPRRVERFVAAAKALQDALGDLNDRAARARLAREVATAHGEPEAAFAAGRLIAVGDDAALLGRARKAHAALGAAKIFW